MIAGEIRDITSYADLRDCPPGAVICDGRGRAGTLATRPSSTLAEGIYWAGVGGISGNETITFPVQAWWPRHPTLVAKGA